MRAADVMHPLVWTVTPDTPVAEACRIMRDHRVRHLPVVDAHERIVGMLSDRDLLRVVVDLGPGPDDFVATPDPTVAGLMTRPVRVIGPDDEVRAIAETLVDRHIGALPVVDDGLVVGIVSYVDLLALFPELLPEPAPDPA